MALKFRNLLTDSHKGDVSSTQALHRTIRRHLCQSLSINFDIFGAVVCRFYIYFFFRLSYFWPSTHFEQSAIGCVLFSAKQLSDCSKRLDLTRRTFQIVAWKQHTPCGCRAGRQRDSDTDPFSTIAFPSLSFPVLSPSQTSEKFWWLRGRQEHYHLSNVYNPWALLNMHKHTNLNIMKCSWRGKVRRITGTGTESKSYDSIWNPFVVQKQVTSSRCDNGAMKFNVGCLFVSLFACLKLGWGHRGVLLCGT